MKRVISQFFELVANQEIEIYNEFSLQHELGIFLRAHYPDTKIQFERNVSYFGFDKSEYEKKEIDLVMFTSKSELNCVMELKYPRNGQVPESMFSFCKDIAFLEQLSKSGFKSAYFIAVADDNLFYSGGNDGIYGLFRDEKSITGKIIKPTGKKDKSVNIIGSYKAHWQKVIGKTKYCLIEVSS
jgi:hypothetical protein